MQAQLDTDYLRSRFEIIAMAGLRTPETMDVLTRITDALQKGILRVVENENGIWKVNSWVKRALLLQSHLGEIRPQTGPLPGLEPDTLRWRSDLPHGCFVPSGSHFRQSAFIGDGSAVNPGTVVQAGARIGQRCVIDSHVLIGICACLGDRVVVQAGAVIGGSLLPIEALPNVIEEDCILGGNSGVYNGVILGVGCILLPGVVLNAQGSVFDLRSEDWIMPDSMGTLTIPPMSVLMMGTRPAGKAERRMQVAVPTIIGTRKTVASPHFERIPDF